MIKIPGKDYLIFGVSKTGSLYGGKLKINFQLTPLTGREKLQKQQGKNNDYIKAICSMKDIVRKVGRQVIEQMIFAKPKTEIDI